MKIKEKAWGPFRIEELFNVDLSKGDIKLDEVDPGDVPLISAGESDNGVIGYISSEGDGVAEIFSKHKITVDMFCHAFYQSLDFYAVSHGRVNILTPKNTISIMGMLFICTLINKEAYKFSYGRALYSDEIGRMEIKLPLTNDKEPDWEYIDERMKNLHHKPLTTDRTSSSINIDAHGWKEFRLEKIFNIKKGKRLTSEDQLPGKNVYIGAIDSNNGVANYIEQEPIHEGNTISLSYNGSVGEAFYQPDPFWATDDVNVLYFKEENNHVFNKYIGLFICAVLRQEKYRFSYGRKWTLENMNKATIKLPVDENGEPNWDWMEKYIKSLPMSEHLVPKLIGTDYKYTYNKGEFQYDYRDIQQTADSVKEDHD